MILQRNDHQPIQMYFKKGDILPIEKNPRQDYESKIGYAVSQKASLVRRRYHFMIIIRITHLYKG